MTTTSTSSDEGSVLQMTTEAAEALGKGRNEIEGCQKFGLKGHLNSPQGTYYILSRYCSSMVN